MTQPTLPDLTDVPPPPPPTPVVACPLCGSVYEPSNAKVHQQFHATDDAKAMKWTAEQKASHKPVTLPDTGKPLVRPL